MVYKVYTPHYRLKPYIKCFWTLEGSVVPGMEHKEKVLPDGCIEMIFHYRDAFKKISADGVADAQPQGFIMGQIKKYIEIVPTGNIGVIGTRFYPNGLSAFTNIPVNEFTNRSVTLDNFFGGGLHELRDKMPEVNNWDRVHLLEDLLMKKVNSNKYDFAIDRIVKNIQQHKGRVDLNHMLKNIKISERHFERQFKKAVGVNPKFFARLIRFNNIMQMVNDDSNIKPISLSYVGGYYDQAHFIKDFAAFSGESPGDYINASHTLSSLFLRD